MRRFTFGAAAMLSLLALTGCPDGKITPAESVLTACQTYTGLLATANEMDKAGKLSDKQVAAVSKSIEIADPLCGGPAPKYDGSALDTVQVDSAVGILKVVTGAE